MSENDLLVPEEKADGSFAERVLDYQTALMGKTLVVDANVPIMFDYTVVGAAWGSNTGVIALHLGSNVTSIADSAFTDCAGLIGDVVFPSQCTTIGSQAFYYCAGLERIFIGEGCTSIGDYAFAGCTGVTTINCLALAAPTLLGSSCFQDVGTTGIHVPSAGTSGYDAAWESAAGLTVNYDL